MAAVTYPADVQRCFLGPAGEGIARRDVDARIAHAPEWWLATVRASRRAAALDDFPPPKAKTSCAGWLAGTLAPGLSVPVRSKRDGERVVEQLTYDALRSLYDQWRREGCELRLGHDGPVLARGRLDVVLRAPRHELVGPTWEARIADDKHGREALRLASRKGGVGVSIGYHSTRQSIVQRDGVGPVRVVHELRLDHIAVVRDATHKAAFPAARAFGSVGKSAGCPPVLRRDAEVHSWQSVKAQLGIPS